MIRPVTCLCMMIAAGSGLYLYQTKQRTLVLDRQIGAVLKQVDAAHARTATLKAEYSALSQPDRLAGLSQRFLSLRPTAPTQFIEDAELDRHLPPIEIFPKPGDMPPPDAAPAIGAVAALDAAVQGGSPPDGLSIDGAAAKPLVSAVTAAPPKPPAADLAAALAGRRATPPAASSPASGMTGAEATHVAMAAPSHPGPRMAAAALHAEAARPVPHVTDAGYAYRPAPPRPPHPASQPAPPQAGSMLGGASAIDLAPPVPVAN